MTEEPTENSQSAESTNRTRRQTPFSFWLWVWGGTAVAGGLFGFLFVGLEYALLGLVFGIFCASVFAVLPIAGVVIVTRCFGLSRFQVVLGGLAGGMTGIFATQIVFGTQPSPFFYFLAGLLGTLGGELGGHWYHFRAKAQEPLHVSQGNRWRFTLRDLFVRIAVISVLLAAYALVVNSIETARQKQPATTQQQAPTQP